MTMTGQILKLHAKGFGFIRTDGHPQGLFFHATTVRNRPFGDLLVGERVDFEIGTDRDGRPCAVAVTAN
jgi:cold shock CspA family protein